MSNYKVNEERLAFFTKSFKIVSGIEISFHDDVNDLEGVWGRHRTNYHDRSTRSHEIQLWTGLGLRLINRVFVHELAHAIQNERDHENLVTEQDMMDEVIARIGTTFAGYEDGCEVYFVHDELPWEKEAEHFEDNQHYWWRGLIVPTSVR